MPTNDEHLYLRAMQEADGNNRLEGLWAKALTLEKGNAEQAKYLYVQLRVVQLQKATVATEIAPSQPVSIEQPDETELEPKIVPDSKFDLAAEGAQVEKDASAYFFVSPSTDLSKYTVVALWVLVAMCVVAIISDAIQLNLLENIRSISTEDADSNDQRVLVVAIIHFGIIIISSIMVLMWKYKANINCHGFGAQGLRFTPGWAVGWDFVPFMNFFRPYQVMQEIWKASSDPVTWQCQSGSTLIRLWWTACVISMLVGNVYSKAVMKNLFHDESIRQLEEATSLSIISSGAILVSAVMTIFVILAIDEKQNKLVIESEERFR